MLNGISTPQKVAFGTIYHVPNDDYGTSSRAIAKKFNDNGVPAIAINVSDNPGVNFQFTNLVITGKQLEKLNKTKGLIQNNMENMYRSEQSRVDLINYSNKFNDLVIKMRRYDLSDKDNINDIVVLSSEEDRYKDEPGRNIDLSDAKGNAEATEELKKVFGGNIPKNIFVAYPNINTEKVQVMQD
jgi:hypothetical protein